MNSIIRTIAYNGPDYPAIWALREKILRQPIGLSLKDEDLSGEADQYILAAYQGGDTLAGCVLLQPYDSITIKLRQMAVDTDFQGKGIGRELVAAAEQFAWAKGYDQVTLHARKTAVGFYAKLGYTLCSDEFSEVGIPHFAMEKHRS